MEARFRMVGRKIAQKATPNVVDDSQLCVFESRHISCIEQVYLSFLNLRFYGWLFPPEILRDLKLVSEVHGEGLLLYRLLGGRNLDPLVVQR